MWYLKKILRKIRWYCEILLWRELYIKKGIDISIQVLGNDWGDRWVDFSNISHKSIVYSFGIGHDISFDKALIQETKCTIHAFDPTPKSLERLKRQTIPAWLIVHPWWIADYNGTTNFFVPKHKEHVSHTMLNTNSFTTDSIEVPVKKLSSIMKELWHTSIDILKMDIEWAEYNVIKNMLIEDIFPKQLLVEVHHRFSGINLTKTKELNSSLIKNWYKLAYISPTGQEYSWIKQ
jgi:FkbM family methyltransferase